MVDNSVDGSKRREGLYMIKAQILSLENCGIDNGRAGYWHQLLEIKQGLKLLEQHQFYEENADKSTEVINDKARKKYEEE